MKKVLMVAYHFPPLAGSSGIQRTLRFVQHLPKFGWQPIVLTAHPRAYERTSDDLLTDIPSTTVVRRAFALDTARHLQVAGRYLGWTARPDRWISWQFDAVRQGLKLVKEHQPDLIWSTYPIATAHVIASKLHQKTGIPWVADFRDPMAQDGYPSDPLTRQSYLDIEADAAAHASFCVFTTPGAAQTYRQRYPSAAGRMVVVENGYDEESFSSLPMACASPPGAQTAERPHILLHSGIIYPSERDPSKLFEALSLLRAQGQLSTSDVCIRFRASVHDDLLQTLAAQFGVLDFIELCPPISYRAALAEMLSVDALLVMQASNCNAQIPAKLYEYLRAGKPILALTDPVGDTAGVLREAGMPSIAGLDSAPDIAQALATFLQQLKTGTSLVADETYVKQASRVGRTQRVAQLFGDAIASSSTGL